MKSLCRTLYHHIGRSSRSTHRHRRWASTDSLLERIKDLTPIDVEKELFKVKRNMGAYYAKGYYQDALMCAAEMEEAIELLMGRQTAMYASALNNVALMNKMLGNIPQAMDKYTQSLQIYHDVVGKQHASYAATLSNLGILYRTQAETSKGMEKQELLQRAEEALGDAHTLRLSLHGPAHRETLASQINLSSLLRLTDRVSKAEATLLDTLEICRQHYGQDALTAQVLNALGILCKAQQRPDEARAYYIEALHIRSSTVGDAHPDTIVSKHNLAELLLQMGPESEAEAHSLQEEILNVVEKIGSTRTAASTPAATANAVDDSTAPAPASPVSVPIPAPSPPRTTAAAATKTTEPPPFTFATRRRKKG